jgi:hypothetical protein
VHCGEEIDEWEIVVEPEIQVRRPVLLWKHRRDGAVSAAQGQQRRRSAEAKRRPTDIW